MEQSSRRAASVSWRVLLLISEERMSNDECLLNHEWPNVEWQAGRSIGDSEIRRSFVAVRVVRALIGPEKTGFHHKGTKTPRNLQTVVLGTSAISPRLSSPKSVEP
jgi:hypothetical protein